MRIKNFKILKCTAAWGLIVTLLGLCFSPAIAQTAAPLTNAQLTAGVPGGANMAFLVVPYSKDLVSAYRRAFKEAHEHVEPLEEALNQAKTGLVHTVIFQAENPTDTALILSNGQKVATTRLSPEIPVEFKSPGIVNFVLPHEGEPPGWLSPDSLTVDNLFQGLYIVIIFLVGLSLLRRYTKMPLERINPKDIPTRFNDVAAQKHAKFELQEVVEFLRNPKRYETLGARVPGGVLLVGPAGNGKTEIARAIAGEASVPFFSITGSDFMEMFVGVGSSRARRSFAAVRGTRFVDFITLNWRRGGILFIDEIDGIGARRTGGSGDSATAEREQTLNTILTELDGLSKSKRRRGGAVVVIAATNRPQILDEALLRPGRFDRQVQVSIPDRAGRIEILKVHTRKLPLAKDVDLVRIAAGTPGFSGASLANLANEAAIQAGRRRLKTISMACFLAARDRIILGNPRGKLVMSHHQRQTLAYHEAGHALMAIIDPEADPVEKATILNFGMALGHVMQVPIEDRWISRKSELLARVRVVLAGRVSEEITFGQDAISSGADSDFKHANSLLCKMASSYAMYENVRHLSLDRSPSIGSSQYSGDMPPLSEASLQALDTAIKVEMDRLYDEVKNILLAHQKCLSALAQALLDHETLTLDQINEIAVINGVVLQEKKNGTVFQKLN